MLQPRLFFSVLSGSKPEPVSPLAFPCFLSSFDVVRPFYSWPAARAAETNAWETSMLLIPCVFCKQTQALGHQGSFLFPLFCWQKPASTWHIFSNVTGGSFLNICLDLQKWWQISPEKQHSELTFTPELNPENLTCQFLDFEQACFAMQLRIAMKGTENVSTFGP